MTTIDPSNLFGFLIQDLARLLSRSFERTADNLTITRAQARVLAFVAMREGPTQSEVAALMDIQKIALTKLVDGLEAQHLLFRRPDPKDRRIRRLYMTDKSHAVLASIWSVLAEVSEQALSVLPPDRQAAILHDLAIVRASMNNSEAGTNGKQSTEAKP